ncbi:MAG: hypothetical protein AB7I44_21130 [Hyphomicrobiaceae bacterium]
MTQPNTNTFSDVIATVKDAPRWLIITVVIAGGLLAYWLVSGKETVDTTAQDYGDWRSRAIEMLVERGYYRASAERAVDAYLNGGFMGPEDISLMTIVIRAMGAPARGTAESGTDSLPDISSYPIDTGGDISSYWYVQAAPAGWSSTFNGIAQQFYGDTSRAVMLQEINPGLSTTTYGKIPMGSRVKVPRT